MANVLATPWRFAVVMGVLAATLCWPAYREAILVHSLQIVKHRRGPRNDATGGHDGTCRRDSRYRIERVAARTRNPTPFPVACSTEPRPGVAVPSRRGV